MQGYEVTLEIHEELKIKAWKDWQPGQLWRLKQQELTDSLGHCPWDGKAIRIKVLGKSHMFSPKKGGEGRSSKEAPKGSSVTL